MGSRRIFYLASLLCCAMFFVAYGQWLGAVLLITVLLFPVLSLLLSLPAMGFFRLTIQGDLLAGMGEEAGVYLVGSSILPLLPFKGRLCLKNLITGEILPCEETLPTDHCGGYRAFLRKPRVCDYLGLWAFPLRKPEEKRILILPDPVPLADLPDLGKFVPRVWKPKFGGGFGENHELRLYRPGDSLNQVHWKLSAKTGTLTIREAMEPIRGRLLLTMTLRGTPDERDRKFGRLLWLGRRLLQKELPFDLRVLTGEGILSFSITEEAALNKALRRLLCTPAAREGSIRDQDFSAFWQYHIGGEPDD